MNIKILVYPKDTNHYQEELYKNMENVIITYLSGPTKSATLNNLLLPFLIFKYRLSGYKIFHLHWAYGLTFYGDNYISYLISTIYYYFILIFIKICGYKIVWTVHNVLPHKKLFLNDTRERRFLAKVASIKIVHSKHTINEMKNINLNISNTSVIPHGNYIDSYPNEITKINARKILGINNPDFVYLFFGRIEKYKGIENLLKAYTKLNFKNSKLIIAGTCKDNDLKKILNKYRDAKNIIIKDQYIPDNEIQTYMNASDIVVYPFEKVTTSGSVLLSLSFSRPIIYHNIGNLIELPNNIGYAYNDELKLVEVLKQASSNEISDITLNAFKYACTLNWVDISEDTKKLYQAIIT